MIRKRVIATAEVFLVLAFALLTCAVAAQGKTVHVLWGDIVVRVPLRSHQQFERQNLGLGVYRFSDSAKPEHLISIQYDFLDAPGFLTKDEFAKSHIVTLNGLTARRYVANRVVYLQVKLPRPAGCPIQFYTLVTFRVGDRWSGDIARTLSIAKPYRCSNVVP